MQGRGQPKVPIYIAVRYSQMTFAADAAKTLPTPSSSAKNKKSCLIGARSSVLLTTSTIDSHLGATQQSLSSVCLLPPAIEDVCCATVPGHVEALFLAP